MGYETEPISGMKEDYKVRFTHESKGQRDYHTSDPESALRFVEEVRKREWEELVEIYGI